MVGTYGVVSYSVARRTREIAVRVALGAQPSAILAMILREGGGLCGAGIVLGVLGSLAAARVVSNLLFDTSTVDALTFSVVTASLVVMTVLACYIPARRAMRVDPMVALRHE